MRHQTYLTQVLAHRQTCADLKVLDLLLELVAQDCPLGVISVSLQQQQSGLQIQHAKELKCNHRNQFAEAQHNRRIVQLPR